VIVECPKCSKKYKIDEEKYFKEKDEVSLKCPSCGEVIRVKKGEEKKFTSPPTQKFKMPDNLSAQKGEDIPDAELLAMPNNFRISVAVLSGNDAGAVFQIKEPVTVIGRAGCDIVLNDPEISRRHARIEIRDTSYTLRDLKSTNGTYINEQHIQVAPIENRTEFRIGSTIMMFLTTKDDFS
jgi:predicted Zn finger-like uncharacterized protein